MQPLLPRASVRSAFQTSIRSTHRAGRRLIVAMTSSTTPIYGQYIITWVSMLSNQTISASIPADDLLPQILL